MIGNHVPMEAVRAENFALSGWTNELYRRLCGRYPGARLEAQNPSVAIVRLRTSRPWEVQDEAFWAELKAQGIIQRWEPLKTVPPEARHNQSLYTDIGYRIGSGERLTVKQQEVLLSQLHDLELRAGIAEKEALEQRLRAEGLEEHAEQTVWRHNQFAVLLSLLKDETGIQITGEFTEGWTAEDMQSGKVLARAVTLPEAYRAALRERLGEGRGRA